MADKPALEMREISKTFNRVVEALKKVDLVVHPGEVHGLVGENGAGKSTLMNILGGVIEKDEGTIRRHGKEVYFRSTQDARDNAVSFIHQELNLILDLRVYENIFLGEELTGPAGIIDKKAMVAETKLILKKMEMDIDPEEVVGELDATKKQVVEIARALHQKSDLIIMDEPTTSLTDHEIESVFKIIKTLKEQKVSIIFISHKLKEILTICDSFTVLRDGEYAGGGGIEGIAEEDIVKLMVGRDLANHDYLSDLEYTNERRHGEMLLEVENFTIPGHVDDVSFKLRQGEILGFTGLLGDGRSELFEGLFGVRAPSSGTIKLHGKEVEIKHPTKARDMGIGYIPKDRKENAIIHGMSIIENMTLPSISKFVRRLVINRKKEIERGVRQQERMRIKLSNLRDVIENLSGGNQQKVVLAKWLEADSDVIILDNPTQGIDVGAKGDIYELLVELANSGKAIIVLSSDFNEINRICDRVLVMFHGKVVGNLSNKEADEETLMMYTTGVKQDSMEAING